MTKRKLNIKRREKRAQKLDLLVTRMILFEIIMLHILVGIMFLYIINIKHTQRQEFERLVQIQENQILMSLNSTDRLLDEIFDVYSEDNVKKEKMVLELLEDVKEYILICPEQFSKYYEDYDLYYNRIQDYQQMIRKLKNIQVIEYMDMSKTIRIDGRRNGICD